MKLIAILLATSTVLSGCATAYQPQGYTGGFSETQLQPNVFRVSFKGNGATSAERAADFALLRSADLALTNGFSYFVIVDSNSSTAISTHTLPTTTQTTGTVSTYGNTGYINAQSTSYGGETMVFRKPTSSNVIVCFTERPDVTGLVYDASFLRGSLGRQYGLNK